MSLQRLQTETATIRHAWRIAMVSLAAALIASPANADPITFSTSGTIDIPNEPDKALSGVTGESITGSNSPLPVFGISWPYDFGSVNILPIYAFQVPGSDYVNPPPPDYAHTTADIKVSFSDAGIPSLDIKAAFGNFDYEHLAYIGNVTSIASSNPALNGNLPPQFAAMLANPEGLKLKIGMWDWGTTSVSIAATYQPVPEPATITIFLALAVGLGFHRRHFSWPNRAREADGSGCC
jgi:hypothetical protein